jgi:hypothetical protein
MRDDPKVYRSPVLGVVAGGLLLGHALSYLVAVPDPHSREALLARTGHAYLPFASQVALILAMAALAILGMRAIGGRATALVPGSRRFVPRIVAVQVPAFIALELVERWYSGAGFGDLASDGLLVFGTAAQIATAIVGAVILRWTWRASARAGSLRRFIDLPHPAGVSLVLATTSSDAPWSHALAGASASRAPPRP